MAASAIPVILLSVLCSSTAHFFLKKGSAVLTSPESTRWLDALTNGWLWGGLALHGAALLTWVIALSRSELSFAYPFIALGFVFTAVFSAAFMHETLSPLRLAGMGLIVSGLLCVAKG